MSGVRRYDLFSGVSTGTPEYQHTRTLNTVAMPVPVLVNQEKDIDVDRIREGLAAQGIEAVVWRVPAEALANLRTPGLLR